MPLPLKPTMPEMLHQRKQRDSFTTENDSQYNKSSDNIPAVVVDFNGRRNSKRFGKEMDVNPSYEADIEAYVANAKNLISKTKPNAPPEVLENLESNIRDAFACALIEIIAVPRSLPQLSEADIETLHKHAKDHPWLGRKTFGYPHICSPLLFIQKEYKYWIDRGLTRPQLRAADKDLLTRLDRWLQESDENKLPDGFLPLKGSETAAVAEVLSLELIEVAARIKNRDRMREVRERPGISKRPTGQSRHRVRVSIKTASRD